MKIKKVIWLTVVASLYALARGGDPFLVNRQHERDDQDVADSVNALYWQNDTGALIHNYGSGEEQHGQQWRACLTKDHTGCSDSAAGRLTFSILNHFVENGVSTNPWGYLGTQRVAADLSMCVFLYHNMSYRRSHNGCGQEDKPGNDWCPHPVINSDWRPYNCAFRPDESKKVLTIARGLSDAGVYSDWNEVVVNGASWNKDVSDNIWAFVVYTDEQFQCGKGTECFQEFLDMYNAYRREHGEKTILAFDVANKDGPFAPLAQPPPDPPQNSAAWQAHLVSMGRGAVLLVSLLQFASLAAMTSD